MRAAAALVALLGPAAALVARRSPVARSARSSGRTTPKAVAELAQVAADHAHLLGPAALDTTSLVAFADQGGNLAGKFFMGSLPPYLAFLYFLGYEKNQTPPLVKFGFAYLLLFVAATIPTGLISKANWGCSLADADWLHGGAESLLTVTNVLLLIGFRSALKGDTKAADLPAARYVSGFMAVAVVALVAAGIPVLHLGAHDAFLGGANLFGTAGEPENALSVATWAVHVSSVCEFVLAMALARQYAEATGNDKWKGFAWGMLPSHASGVCACTYHLFYNQAAMAWIVTLQAGCTALGNTTLAYAAYRLAVSNGWTLKGALPGGNDEASAPFDAGMLNTVSDMQPAPLVAAELAAVSLVGALAVKYGSLPAQDFLTTPQSAAAAALIFAVPLLVAVTVLPPLGEEPQQETI
ncbi:hypothetical protein M885DRAFT_617260 [Pelagophyceae sp. CCMP2097]|nr:hypothetical protein M885DRAFT_617260 [Pelagophyceae sp. CCMP2097]